MRQILFVELLNGIGDLLIALPAIQAIGRSHPQAELTVLTFPPGGELLRRDPLIHRVTYALRNDQEHPHRTRESVEAFLADRSFDLIVSDTCYDGIEGVLQEANPPRAITNLWRRPPPDERVADRFLRILLEEGVVEPAAIAPPRLHLTREEMRYAQERLGEARHPIAFLVPDAGMAIKRWPPGNFVALGRDLQRLYDATVIVPEGPGHSEAARVVAEIGGGARLYPHGALRDLAAVLALADLVVASDTGPAHIAAVLGVPTLTLFGPSWHGRYGQLPPHGNLQGYPECPERVIRDFTLQRCWYSGVCPLGLWRSCLEDISPARVLASAARFLEGWEHRRTASVGLDRLLPPPPSSMGGG